MAIDWFTICAQLVNFFVLVWLLKKFLYRPILDAIDKREKRIAGQMENADMKMAGAQKEIDEFRRKNMEIDQERSRLLSSAADDAQEEGRRLLDEARSTAAAMSEKLNETLQNERITFYHAASRKVKLETYNVTRKALTDLAETGLEERMVDIFVRKLNELNEDEKKLLISARQTESNPVIISTMYELSKVQCDKIEDAVKKNICQFVQVNFRTSPDLICGIELISNGQKIAWSFDDYVSSIEKSMDEILEGNITLENRTGRVIEDER